MKYAPTFALALALAAVATPVRAEDFDEGGRLYAVQNRKHVVAHGFDLALGVMPMDAFYKGFTAAFGYTYHFDDLFAWEIVRGGYSLALDTNLRDDLQSNFGVQPTEFPELRIFGRSNLVLKPLYGKLVLFNTQLMYIEGFMTIGPAVAEYKNAGVFVGGNLGGGIRIFLSRAFALRFDVTQYLLVDPSGLEDVRNELHIEVGIGLNIR